MKKASQKMSKKTVLFQIDLQNDFFTGGPLAVPDAEAIVPKINQISSKFDHVIASQDWHPSDHISFHTTHKDAAPFTKININDLEMPLWPPHCVQGTSGADFFPTLDTRPIQFIVRKAFRSNFEAFSIYKNFGNNNEKNILENLFQPIEDFQFFICGLALDFCVFHSAIDARELGYDVSVILDLTKAIGKEEDAIEKLKNKGVKIVNSSELWFNQNKWNFIPWNLLENFLPLQGFKLNNLSNEWISLYIRSNSLNFINLNIYLTRKLFYNNL